MQGYHCETQHTYRHRGVSYMDETPSRINWTTPNINIWSSGMLLYGDTLPPNSYPDEESEYEESEEDNDNDE